MASATAPNYKVGMIVDHPARPQWGPGKIVAIDDLRLHVYFKNDPQPVAKAFMRSLAPLNISDVQTDEVLDALPKVKEDRGSYSIPRKPAKKIKAKPVAAAAE